MNNQFFADLPMTGNSFAEMLENIPASMYCKDKNGLYLEVNNYFLKTSNMTNAQEVLQRTDMDMPWMGQAEIMMANDKEVLVTGITKTVIEPALCFGTMHLFLSHKTRLRDRHQKIIGTFGISVMLDDVSTTAEWLNNMGFPLSSIDVKRINAHFANANELTKRQANCLYYLARGMTIKEIGKTVNLAPKTVEHYLARVKIKLNCRTRADLIAKGLELVRDRMV